MVQFSNVIQFAEDNFTEDVTTQFFILVAVFP